MACLARNNTLILGSNRTPASIVFGKSDYFYSLDGEPIQSEEELTSGEARIRRHLMGIAVARSEIMKIDARKLSRPVCSETG